MTSRLEPVTTARLLSTPVIPYFSYTLVTTGSEFDRRIINYYCRKHSSRCVSVIFLLVRWRAINVRNPAAELTRRRRHCVVDNVTCHAVCVYHIYRVHTQSHRNRVVVVLDDFCVFFLRFFFPATHHNTVESGWFEFQRR